MTSIIKNQLLKRLGRYVKNLSREQLHISSLRGAINLSDLEFDEDAMTDLLELPDWLRLQRMTCNKVQVSIPWTQLSGKSIKVVLDEVRVDMVTCDHLRPTKSSAPAADAASSTSSGSDKGFGSVTGGKYGFIEKVIDGIQIIINLVDVNFYTPRFHLSVHIDRLDVYSCTPKWQPTTDDFRRARVKSEARGQTLIFKRLDWQTMRITAQELMPAAVDGSNNQSNVASSFRILASASILLKMKRRLSDSSILFATLTALLDETLIVLTDSQLIGACGFIEDLHKLIAKSNEATKLERARAKMDDVKKNHESMKTSTKNSSPARKSAANQPPTLPPGLQRLPSVGKVLTKEELFTVLDMQETSYHVNMRSVELQLCDETPEEGSMRIMLSNLHLDLYPFHCESWSSSDFNMDSLGDFDILSSQKYYRRYEDTVVVGSPFGGNAARMQNVAPSGGSGKTYLPHTKERLAWKKKLLLTKRIQFNRSMLLHKHHPVGTSATAGSNNPKPLQPSMDAPLLLSSNVLITLSDINASAVTKRKVQTNSQFPEGPVYDAPLVMSLRELLKLPPNLPVMFVEHVEFFFPSLPPQTVQTDAAEENFDSRRDLPGNFAGQLLPPSNLMARSTSHIDPTWSSPLKPHQRAGGPALLSTMTSVNEAAVQQQQQHGLSSDAGRGGGKQDDSASATIAALVPNSLLYININPMQVTLHIDSIEWFAGRLRYILPELSELLGILAPIPASGSEFIDKIARTAAAKLAAPDTDMFVDCMMLKIILPTELPYELLEEMPFHGTFGSASLNSREKLKPAALVATVSNLTVRINVDAFDRLPSEEGLGEPRSIDDPEPPPVLTVQKVFERILRQVNSSTNPNLAPGSKPMQTADQLKFNFVIKEMQRRYEYGQTHRGPSVYKSAHNQQNMMLISIEQLWVETEGPKFFAMPIIRAIPLRVAVISMNAASLARQLISHASEIGGKDKRIDPYFLSILSETVESVQLVWVSLPTRRAIVQLQRVVLHAFIRAIDRLTVCIDDIQMAIADVVHEQHVMKYAPLPPSALRHGNYLLLMTDGIEEACADLVLTLKPPTREGGEAGVVTGVADLKLKDEDEDLSRQNTITSIEEAEKVEQKVVPRGVHFEAPRHGDAYADASRARPTFSPPATGKNVREAAEVGGVVFFDSEQQQQQQHGSTKSTRFVDPDLLRAAGAFDTSDADSVKSSSGISSSSTVTSVPSLSKLDEMYADEDDDRSSIGGTDSVSNSDFVIIDNEDEFNNEEEVQRSNAPKLQAALRRAFTRFDTAVEDQQDLDEDEEEDDLSFSTPASTLARGHGGIVKPGSILKSSPATFVEDLRDRLTFAVQNIDVIVEAWPRMQIQPPAQPPVQQQKLSGVASPTRVQVPRSVNILVVRVAVKRVKVADTQRLQWQEVQRMYQRQNEEYAKILHASFPLAAAQLSSSSSSADELKQVSVLFVKDPMEDGVAAKKGRLEVAAGGLGVDLAHHIAQALGDFGADTDFMAHLPPVPTSASVVGGPAAAAGQLPIKLYLHDVRVQLGDVPLVPRYQPVAYAVAAAAAAAALGSGKASDGEHEKLMAVGGKSPSVVKNEASEMFGPSSNSSLKHTTPAASDKHQSPLPLSAAALLSKSTTTTTGTIGSPVANSQTSTADLHSQLEHFEMMRKNAQYMIENIQNLMRDRGEMRTSAASADPRK